MIAARELARLDPALAQRLVDQVVPALDHNVNIMDGAGLIVGSADPERIGTVHAGARRAARRRRPVTITAETAGPLERAGVNIPLVVDDEVRCVVGVTGDPTIVRPVAQVLVLAIRLILATEWERDERAVRDGLARDLIAALPTGSLSPSDLRERAGRIGVALEPPWMLLVHRDDRAGDDGRSRPPAAVARLLRALGAEPGLLAVDDELGIWSLVGRADAAGPDRAVALAAGFGAATVVGGITADIAALASDARRLTAVLTCARLVPAGGRVLLADLDAEFVIAALDPRDRRRLGDRLLGELPPELRRTVAAFASTGASVAASAEHLHVHRNTVVHRLDRIATRSGLDPRRPADLLRLHLGTLAMTADGAPS